MTVPLSAWYILLTHVDFILVAKLVLWTAKWCCHVSIKQMLTQILIYGICTHCCYVCISVSINLLYIYIFYPFENKEIRSSVWWVSNIYLNKLYYVLTIKSAHLAKPNYYKTAVKTQFLNLSYFGFCYAVDSFYLVLLNGTSTAFGSWRKNGKRSNWE